MTSEDHIAKMTTAIRLAIKVMGDRFGSTEQDVANAIQELKTSMPASTAPRATQGDSTAQQSVSAG
jgi:type IV secretory pathway TrbL component